jgi:hypothetical protein
MFCIESNLPWSARAFLVGTAIGTSSVSTAVIAWAGRSYVTALRLTKSPKTDAVEQVELTTWNLLLQPRITRVRCAFLHPLSPKLSIAIHNQSMLIK